MKRRRRLSALGEPMHVGKIYVAHVRQSGGPVPSSQIKKIENLLTGRLGKGGVTFYRAEGRWKSNPNEPTTVGEVFASTSVSCKIFTKRVREAARLSAKLADQQAAVAVVQCVGQPTDVTFEAGRDRSQALSAFRRKQTRRRSR